ncbi:P-loop NTPase family protein [Roseivirga misakiensis]|uniref:AAA+ ATPase domain-containing protein n=1 Tax=Roseivirga misakiensis TaxID=1563681 RepID=A0A1E5SL40_9BACT|nr:hypothetical protein [Roseivirga misakiensis]OEJ99840.1 hypothetical protein BFP71_09830 [Roseivirga misakiensis]
MTNLMVSHNLNLVFTPTAPAKLSFVERDESINDDLVDALRTPGMQIVVYGPSGAGKTTLLVNKLNQLYENHVITRCMKGMTFEQILVDGFDQLNKYYTDEKSFSTKSSISLGIKSEYLSIKNSFEENIQEVSRRLVPVQLTPQRLGKFFGEMGICWVLEDFHKVEEPEKVKIAQIMKIFMDYSVDYPDLKILAIGAVNTAREVIKYDPEMKQRVAEIYVPLMNENELSKVIYSGEELLNIKFQSTVVKRTIKFSSGLASACHHLCLNMCRKEGIESTQVKTVTLNVTDFDKAVSKYVKSSSDTLKEIFDKAMKVSRSRKYNNPRIILKAILDLGKDELSYNEILTHIRIAQKEYPAGNLTSYLSKLQGQDRGSILRHDEISGLYSFSSPFVKAYSHCILTQTTKKGLSTIEVKLPIEELTKLILENLSEKLKAIE